jgi:hypothetical protein
MLFIFSSPIPLLFFLLILSILSGFGQRNGSYHRRKSHPEKLPASLKLRKM